MGKEIYLSIAGFRLLFVLQNTEYLQSQRLFIRQFLSYFGGFIIKPEMTSIPHLTFHITEERTFSMLKHKHKNYIEHFRVSPDKKTVHSFYSVSAEQLVQVISYALFDLLKKEGGCIIHSSVGIRKGEAYLFLGASGAGKSTIIRLIHKHVTPFADDVCIVRRVGGRYICFQTPSLDKTSLFKKTHRGYPVSHIFFLIQSKKTILSKMGKNKVLPLLSKEVVANKDSLTAYLRTIFALTQSGFCKFWELNFRKSSRSVCHALGFYQHPVQHGQHIPDGHPHAEGQPARSTGDESNRLKESNELK